MGKMSMIHQEITELYLNGVPMDRIAEVVQMEYGLSIEHATSMVERLATDPTVNNDYYEDDSQD
jgi:hypothetical protein